MVTRLLCLVLSTLGTIDQPGWWPPEYVLGAKILLVLLILLIVWKALTWILRSRRSAEE